MQFSLVKQQKVICGSALFSFFHTIVFFVFLVHWHGHKILSSLSLCHELIQFLTLFFLNAISPYHALFGVNFVRGIDDRFDVNPHSEFLWETFFFYLPTKKKRVFSLRGVFRLLRRELNKNIFCPKIIKLSVHWTFFFGVLNYCTVFDEYPWIMIINNAFLFQALTFDESFFEHSHPPLLFFNKPRSGEKGVRNAAKIFFFFSFVIFLGDGIDLEPFEFVSCGFFFFLFSFTR